MIFSSLLSDNAEDNQAGNVDMSSQETRKRQARHDSTDNDSRRAKKQATACISQTIEAERAPSAENSPQQTSFSEQKLVSDRDAR